jgi:cell division septation protein DedD
MPRSPAATVDAYLASLPEDRRAAIAAVRAVINANLPDGYREGMQFGMIGWCVPLARFPDTYNGQPLGLAALASQKQYMALYLMSVYGDRELETWFRDAFAAAGKQLDMGKSCVRFKTLDALPLDVIGQTIAKVPVDAYLAKYAAAKRQQPVKKKPKKPTAKKPTTKKPTTNKPTTKKPTTKKPTTKKPTKKRAR